LIDIVFLFVVKRETCGPGKQVNLILDKQGEQYSGHHPLALSGLKENNGLRQIGVAGGRHFEPVFVAKPTRIVGAMTTRMTSAAGCADVNDTRPRIRMRMLAGCRKGWRG
jgi:hypothetical protein